jgi:hypothetical protein
VRRARARQACRLKKASACYTSLDARASCGTAADVAAGSCVDVTSGPVGTGQAVALAASMVSGSLVVSVAAVAASKTVSELGSLAGELLHLFQW